MKIRTSEVFASFQGEGPFAGTPTLWIRLFGCNLECNGFGQDNPMAPETYVLPYQTIDFDNIKKMEDLPVFSRGCDSSYSWSAKYKHLAKDWTPETLVDELMRLGQERFGMHQCWNNHRTKQPIHLCFTGGEPMLQQKAIVAVIKEIHLRNMRVGCEMPQLVNIETNATQKMTPEFIDYFKKTPSFLHFACSPKLFSVSGEKNVVDLDTISQYMEFSPGILKFVVNGTPECWEELDSYIDRIVNLLNKYYCWSLWAMPVGATKEQQELPSVADIANEAMRRGFCVATRNHTYVYGNVVGS